MRRLRRSCKGDGLRMEEGKQNLQNGGGEMFRFLFLIGKYRYLCAKYNLLTDVLLIFSMLKF